MVEDAVRVIACGLYSPCAELLKPGLKGMAKQLIKHRALQVHGQTLQQLERISVSTLKRMLKRMEKTDVRLAQRQAPRSQRNHLRKQYPMRVIANDVPEARHFEVDLGLHCDEDCRGESIHTIQMVDVKTGWREIEAMYGHSYLAMRDGFEAILKHLPFAVRKLHPDNGQKFFNAHLLLTVLERQNRVFGNLAFASVPQK